MHQKDALSNQVQVKLNLTHPATTIAQEEITRNRCISYEE
jgi:hypothetical protein